MKRILIVKVTSLGDVVQTLPVVMDLHRAFPGVEVDWAVDESCAEVVRWSRGVSRVVSAPLRRFKKTRQWRDLRAIAESIRQLRARRYDAVLDLHGVYKSAIIAWMTLASHRFGYRTEDLGEHGARFAYTARFGPRPACDAWQGMRLSAGEALGYAPDWPAVYGMRMPTVGQALSSIGNEAAYALFFHATSNEDKKWPTERWVGLGREMISRGMQVLLPWGTSAEYEEARRIAAGAPGVAVLPPLSVLEIGHLIERAALVVGVDTGFVHLAHALQKPAVMMFLATSRQHCGIAGTRCSLSIGEDGNAPSVVEALAAIGQVYPETEVAAQSAVAS